MAADDKHTFSTKDLHNSVCGLQRLQDSLRNLAAVTEIAKHRLHNACFLLAQALEEEQRALAALDESEAEFLGTGDDVLPAVMIGFDLASGPSQTVFTAIPAADSMELPVKYRLDGEDSPMHFNKVASCIGCGCTDLFACPGQPPCHWLRLDRETQTGVCSECPSLVETWDQARQMQPEGKAR